MRDAALAADPDFATNLERVKRRPQTDGRVAASFASMPVDELTARLAKADIAFGRVSDPEILRRHPHLRRITVGSPSGPVSYPAPAPLSSGEPRRYGPVPALGEHTEQVRAEFGGARLIDQKR
jgi:formyl-CoA transferase